MSKTLVWITLSCCLLAVAIFSWAQAVRKPGLWEMTSTTSWQQAPLPPGVNLPPGTNSPFAPMTRTTQVCLTQDMIDKYGAPMVTGQGNCTIYNVVLQPTSMTAEMTCTGEDEPSCNDGVVLAQR